MIAPLRPAQAALPLTPQGPTTSLAPQSPDAAAQRGALRTAAQQFEAVFLRQMIGSMRQAHLSDDIFGSQATEQFRDMADANLADSMSHQGVFGIAQLLLAQFDRHAAATPAAPAAAGGQAAADANANGSGQ